MYVKSEESLMASRAGVGVWGKEELPEYLFEVMFPLPCGKDVTEENGDMVIASDTPKWKKLCIKKRKNPSTLYGPTLLMFVCPEISYNHNRCFLLSLTWYWRGPHAAGPGQCQDKEQRRWIIRWVEVAGTLS